MVKLKSDSNIIDLIDHFLRIGITFAMLLSLILPLQIDIHVKKYIMHR